MYSNELSRYSGQRGTMPLSEAMTQLFREAFTSPFGGHFTGGGPGNGVNLYEQDQKYFMQVPIPGARLDKFNITARENVITLHGAIELPTPEGAHTLFQGAGGGEFHEQIALPSDIDAEHVSAEYQDGVLTLTLPKARHAMERTISVTPGQSSLGQVRVGTGTGQRTSSGSDKQPAGAGQR